MENDLILQISIKKANMKKENLKSVKKVARSSFVKTIHIMLFDSGKSSFWEFKSHEIDVKCEEKLETQTWLMETRTMPYGSCSKF